MTYVGVLLTLAAVQLLASASPGPSLIIVTSHAATGSRKAGLLAALGVLLGTLTWVSLSALGLGAVFAKHPALYEVVRYFGAAYLVWLGARMVLDAVRNRYPGFEKPTPAQGSARSIVLAGYLVNMTNPKTIAYYTSLFAVLIPATAPTWVFFAGAGVGLAVSTFWWCLIALISSTSASRRFFALTRRYLDLVMGGALIFLGFRLAVAAR